MEPHSCRGARGVGDGRADLGDVEKLRRLEQHLHHCREPVVPRRAAERAHGGEDGAKGRLLVVAEPVSPGAPGKRIEHLVEALRLGGRRRRGGARKDGRLTGERAGRHGSTAPGRLGDTAADGIGLTA